jgi:hypothetical protein
MARDKKFKATTQQKQINIFSQESVRMMEKIMKAIFNQRK